MVLLNYPFDNNNLNEKVSFTINTVNKVQEIVDLIIKELSRNQAITFDFDTEIQKLTNQFENLAIKYNRLSSTVKTLKSNNNLKYVSEYHNERLSDLEIAETLHSFNFQNFQKINTRIINKVQKKNRILSSKLKICQKIIVQNKKFLSKLNTRITSLENKSLN